MKLQNISYYFQPNYAAILKPNFKILFISIISFDYTKINSF